MVPPGIWSETCRRPGSWYRNSDRNGLYLVVSPVELDILPGRREGMVTRSDFNPPARHPGQKEELVRDPEFCSRCLRTGNRSATGRGESISDGPPDWART